MQPPPSPPDSFEHPRIAHAALRHRMLTGAWRDDVVRRARKQFGLERSNNMLGTEAVAFDQLIGDVDMSSNVFANVSTQLATLYDEPFTPLHDDAVAAASMDQLVQRSLVSAYLQTVQRFTLGLRDMFVRVRMVERDGLPVVLVREVFPHLVLAAVPDPDNPGQPLYLEEAVRRDGAWTIDCYDVRRPEAPSFRTLNEAREDITEATHGASMSGDSYPWWIVPPSDTEPGVPLLPIIAYHAAVQTSLWDTYTWSEVVDGTLTCGVYFTYLGHITRQASWPQRWTLDAEPAGAALTGDARAHIYGDPTGVLKLRRREDSGNGQALVGQWAPGADPVQIMDVVERYERRLAQHAGVASSDILRVSGDPRSGYALQLDQSAKARAAVRYEPAFHASDQRLLMTVAALYNGRWPDMERLPLSGWRVSYPLVERARAEAAAAAAAGQSQGGSAT